MARQTLLKELVYKNEQADLKLGKIDGELNNIKSLKEDLLLKIDQKTKIDKKLKD